MLTSLIQFSLKNRFLVLVFTALVAASGVYQALRLPIDAVPDMTNTQVTVITDAGSLSPLEVERYVTFPVEWTMRSIPRVQELRSTSQFGVSVVTIVFHEGTDIHWARNMVNQKLSSAASQIPPGYGTPELGPLATALGEILQFEVRGEGCSSTELRTILDWQITPQLRGVAGVAEINAHGGFYKCYEVLVDPDRLASTKTSMDEVYSALERNNLIAGGGHVVHYGERRFIRGTALLKDIQSIGEVVLHTEPNGAPLLVRDIGEVAEAALTRQGAVTRDGRGEAVTGLVIMQLGENSRTVVHQVKKRIAEIARTLPKGVHIEILYDRSELIERTLHTVEKNLLEGGALVILVLLVMLGSMRAGLVVAVAIPLSMLFASNLMAFTGITASLMSLGAIDFGLIVDSSVIMVENCIRRIAHNFDNRSHDEVILDAAIEVRKPTMFGELIIAIVYLPILALEGTEGKLFRPMAWTVLFALAGSLVLSMTLMPVLASMALPRKMQEHDVFLLRWIKWVYRPVLARVLRHRLLTATVALCVFCMSIPVAIRLGGEFMPRLEEGDILIEANRLPTATLEDAETLTAQIESLLIKLPEVRTVFCKTGRPEIATDVMGVQQSDVWVMLKPEHDWPVHKSREKLVEEIDAILSTNMSGVIFAYSQPIEMRVNELVAGVKADVAVLIQGESLNVLAKKGREIEAVLSRIQGAKDVKASHLSNLSTLTVKVQPDRLARYGISAERVMNVVSAIGGRKTGEVFEGRARFPVMVRLKESWRTHLDRLELIPVMTDDGKPIPLGELAELALEETPPNIEHEDAHRRTYVSANVRGRDVASFVHEAEAAIQREVTLPTGYALRWGGSFEHLQTASLRLVLITPVALLLIFLLLHASVGSVRMAGLIFLAVPIAASGGVFALALRDLPFSISAGVGFIALFGVAVLNGLVWVSNAEQLRTSGHSAEAAAAETAETRLRPVLMTAMVASLGFVPMALSTTAGAEMQRPLATVVIGGLITSTLLTTLVIPAIYPWFFGRTDID